MMRRITAADPARRMPPVASGRTLTDREIDLIQRWIEQGAKWQKHWSFVTPRRRAPARRQNRTWAANPIDRLRPAAARARRSGAVAEADRTTLIRRVTLDLTGLPPTPGEVDAFLADHSPNVPTRRSSIACWHRRATASAWRRVARRGALCRHQRLPDRRRALHVALARLGDRRVQPQHAVRPVHRRAARRRPAARATLDQKIATGFNRNHRGNGEGGIIPEEYAVEYVVDRVDTTSTVWLGLTLGLCPLPRPQVRSDHAEGVLPALRLLQQHSRSSGKAVKYGNSPPMIPAPTARSRRS